MAPDDAARRLRRPAEQGRWKAAWSSCRQCTVVSTYSSNTASGDCQTATKSETSIQKSAPRLPRDPDDPVDHGLALRTPPSGATSRKSAVQRRPPDGRRPCLLVLARSQRRRNRAARRSLGSPGRSRFAGTRAHAGCRAQVVFHDRAVAAVAVALQLERVALRSLALRPGRRRSRARSASVSLHRGDLQIGGEMRPAARADDHRRRPAAGRACTRLATVAMSAPCRSAIAAQRAQQRLEQLPAAEIVDDQLVLGERAVLERRLRLRLRRASGRRGSRRRPCRSSADGCRCFCGSGRPARAPAASSSSEYCTCMLTSGTPAATSFGRVRRVEIGAADQVDLAFLAQLLEPERRSTQPGTL